MTRQAKDCDDACPLMLLEDLKHDPRFILRISHITQWIVGLEDPVGGGVHFTGKSQSLAAAARKTYDQWLKDQDYPALPG